MAEAIKQSENNPKMETDYYDLGTHHRTISTSNKEAQTWFNRGLIWTYAFHHEEAAVCFENAIRHDPHCAMVYWGLAYTLGPNYNKPWEVFDEEDRKSTVRRTHEAITQATNLSATASPVEEALIKGLYKRYPQGHETDDYSIWNVAYAKEMKSIYESYPDDLDVATLYIDSLMNLTPWQLWDLKTGKPAKGARTLEIGAVFDRVLSHEGALEHPGLVHLYIHYMEMSSKPEAALPVANHLRGLVPDSGHLNHMPTHLDILCGDYQSAMKSNSNAILADAKYVARGGVLNFYTLYRAHNYHFKIYAAMFAGQSKTTLDTIAQLEANIPKELLEVKSPPMADWMEGFLGTRAHGLIRFGRWSEIIDLAFPEDRELYCVTTAMIHYAKGIAFAATSRIREAENQRELFKDVFKRVPSSRTRFNNKCIDVLAIADAMLDGELDYRRGDIEAAFSHLRRSIALDDGLHYEEPWGWMQPTRHVYGALLLEQGRVEEAVGVYSADLGFDDSLPRAQRHPNNVWALQGYHECLVKLGRKEEARRLEPQLQAAVALADIPIKYSCFCRLKGLL